VRWKQGEKEGEEAGCFIPSQSSTPIMATEDDFIVEDVNVAGVKPLIPPAILQDELPLTDAVKRHVTAGRKQANNIIHGVDDRLLVVIGPCSIHDYAGAVDYGK
jgi:3-deoxy-7-phosphoheptulonate synthase